MRLSAAAMISAALRRVGGRIELGAEPGELFGDARAHAGRVLADPGREHEGVEAAERRRQHAGVQPDAIDEIVEREARPRIGARLQVAHVVADAGQALQAAFAVEQVLDLRRRSSPSASIR